MGKTGCRICDSLSFSLKVQFYLYIFAFNQDRINLYTVFFCPYFFTFNQNRISPYIVFFCPYFF